METLIFYHAGCPVCVGAEQAMLNLVDRDRFHLEVVHLGEQPERLAEAERAGVQSVPALLLQPGNVLHLNFGASLETVKASVLAH